MDVNNEVTSAWGVVKPGAWHFDRCIYFTGHFDLYTFSLKIR